MCCNKVFPRRLRGKNLTQGSTDNPAFGPSFPEKTLKSRENGGNCHNFLIFRNIFVIIDKMPRYGPLLPASPLESLELVQKRSNGLTDPKPCP